MSKRRETTIPALVLAFGSGATLLGTLRGFGRAGIPVHVASRVDGFVRGSRWCRPLARPISESSDPATLAAALRDLPFERAVLMPCSDNWSVAVAGLPADLAWRFPTSISRIDTQETLVDKGRFADALRRFDVPHPHTVEVRSLADLESMPESCFAAAFLKPCSSQSFAAKYGVKALRRDDKASTIELYKEIGQNGLTLLLQDYIPGPPTCHYFIDGFVDRHGAMLAAFARRRLRMHPADFGNSTCMVSVPPEETAPALASLERLFQGLGFRGIFSAEFKHDSRDDTFKLLEVNARPWWYIDFASACGVNVARLAYLDALGLPSEPIHDYRVGVRCVFPQLDWVACERLHKAGQLSWRTCVRDWIWSKKPISAWDDPLPGVWNAVALVPVALRKLVSRASTLLASRTVPPAGLEPAGTRRQGARMEIIRKVRARLDLIPEALHARRTTGRGLFAQASDLVRLSFGRTRLRAAEYYDFRLYSPRYKIADRRAFAGEWFKKEIHRRLNNKAWEVLMTDKLAQSAYYDAIGLPHARVYAVATSEPRLYASAPCFTEPGPLADFLRDGMTYPFFLKPIKGNEGRSCHSVRAYDPAGDRLALADGKHVGVKEFLAGLFDPTGFGFTFLERLESHPEVRAMCGATVSSLRLIVLLHDEGPELMHADWGVPAGRSHVSNFAKGETGNMVAGLNPETGTILRVVGGTGRDRKDIELHPLSGRRMEGFVLPDWREAVDLSLGAATAFPGARWQNWDIGLTSKGPVILELNSSGDVYAAQYLTETGILAGPLGPFLERYAFRDDRKRPLFLGAAERPPVVEEDALRRAAAAATRVRGSS